MELMGMDLDVDQYCVESEGEKDDLFGGARGATPATGGLVECDADEDTDIDVVIDEYRSSSSLATISLSSVDHRGQAFSSRYFKKCFIHLFGIFDTLSFT